MIFMRPVVPQETSFHILGTHAREPFHSDDDFGYMPRGTKGLAR